MHGERQYTLGVLYGCFERVSEDAKIKPLTILNKLPKEDPFRNCLVENFDLFVSAVLENLESKSIEDEYFEDSADIIVELINQKSLKDNAVVAYLSG